VADIISEMSTASREQSMGLDLVKKAIADMDHMTQQNSAMVEQTSAVADAMTNQAKQLISIVSVFRVETAGQSATHSGHSRTGSTSSVRTDADDESSWQAVA
jgi:methyl-accepting chemotaxis protein